MKTWAKEHSRACLDDNSNVTGVKRYKQFSFSCREFPMLYLFYDDLVENPRTELARVAAFLKTVHPYVAAHPATVDVSCALMNHVGSAKRGTSNLTVEDKLGPDIYELVRKETDTVFHKLLGRLAAQKRAELSQPSPTRSERRSETPVNR